LHFDLDDLRVLDKDFHGSVAESPYGAQDRFFAILMFFSVSDWHLAFLQTIPEAQIPLPAYH
jgi:hypothetical protein